MQYYIYTHKKIMNSKPHVLYHTKDDAHIKYV